MLSSAVESRPPLMNRKRQQRVDDIEGGVEGRQLEEVVAATHHIVDKPADSITCWIEYDEERHDAKHIKEHVGEGSTTRLCVGGERGHKCRNGSTYVLSHGQCCSLLETKAGDVHAEEHQRDSHCGR